MKDKVLVVDDDELVLGLLKRMLSTHFTLDTAPGPHEGLETISKQGPYAVVLSDMRMPHLNGIQFLTKAKEVSPDTICLLLSGDFDHCDIRSADEKVVFKVIDKPCTGDMLVESVHEALAQHHKLRE